MVQGVADQAGGVAQGVADQVGGMVQGNDATPTVEARGYNGLKSDAEHDFTTWPWAALPLPGNTRGVNRRALCICCEYPGKSYTLSGTHVDQQKLVDVLLEMTYDVHYLTDQSSTSEINTEAKLWSNGKHAPYMNGKDRPDGRMHPTKQNILNELEDLCAWLSEEPERMGWVTYSGHGAALHSPPRILLPLSTPTVRSGAQRRSQSIASGRTHGSAQDLPSRGVRRRQHQSHRRHARSGRGGRGNGAVRL